MTITQLVAMERRIHDDEGWRLGDSSSRETRNAFMERVIGCAYWGHPRYNPTPDTQWHCKDPDGPSGGRPASDDVAVSMPTRVFWDTVTGAGRDGYAFAASEGGVLPLQQFVFVPAKPSGSGLPMPTIPPAAAAIKPRDQFYGELLELDAFYEAAEGLQRVGGMVIARLDPVTGHPVISADVEALGAWGYDLLTGVTVDAAKARIRESGEWQAKHPDGQ